MDKMQDDDFWFFGRLPVNHEKICRQKQGVLMVGLCFLLNRLILRRGGSQ